MDKPKITCNDCKEVIVEYYDKSYKGNRGRCPHCGVEFPLE